MEDKGTSTAGTSADRSAGGTVLVVDDEEVIRDLFCEWLGAEGYSCMCAADAAEALAISAEEMPDAALLDLRMRGESGVWLARRLRERSADVALILVTGAQSFDAAVEGMRLGVLDYLLKPSSRREVLATVKRALEWRRSNLQARQERRHLEAEVEKRSVQLSDAFTQLHETSAGALDALLVAFSRRNPDALAHARRVARTAGLLAVAAGVDAAGLPDIQRGALLHDIGKLAMPDALMHKAGPLTEAEIAVVRTHPEIGHDIIATVPFLRTAAEIVVASHEWYDGSGYPRGLAGTEIPLGARITTIADTFDALTCSRAYREPVSAEAATAELVRCSGTQFDPGLVSLWLRLREVTTSDQDVRRLLASKNDLRIAS
jgi:response regulator RpfG family c-di-GMP phosphodiesterase